MGLSAGRQPDVALPSGAPRARLARAVAAVALVDDVLARRRLAVRRGEVESMRGQLAELRAQSAQLAAQLRAEARTDPLTGLANRRRWQEHLVLEMERARRSGTSLAVAVVDLDDFKAVNDTQGHQGGDRALRAVADGFAQVVRTVDLVARVGGDEFAVLLPDLDPPGAVLVGERLLASAAPLTCSVGVALWDGVQSADALEHVADRAMYRAKATGGARLVVG